MSVKVYLDKSIDTKLVDFIKQKLDKSNKIDWVDEYIEDCYWVYIITPKISGKEIFNILSPITFARAEKLIIGLLLTYDGKAFNETKLHLLRYILSALHSENSEVLYNIDDLIFCLEELAWKHELIHIGNKPIGISDTLEFIDRNNKKEENEDANQ